MWWDLLRFQLWWPDRPDILAEIVATLHALLAIPYDPCRESVLHGIGHLRHDYPEHHQQFSVIINALLVQTPGLRAELPIYTGEAKHGEVL